MAHSRFDADLCCDAHYGQSFDTRAAQRQFQRRTREGRQREFVEDRLLLRRLNLDLALMAAPPGVRGRGSVRLGGDSWGVES